MAYDAAADNGSTGPVYFDPYKVEIQKNPYPVYKRMRDEAPLYYNEQHDFYALSRYDDVRAGHGNHETFISSKGGILEMIKQNIQLPPGIFIFEDPPIHTVHRAIVARIFSPRRMNELDGMVRDFTVRTLDKLAPDKRQRIEKAAEALRGTLTSSP